MEDRLLDFLLMFPPHASYWIVFWVLLTCGLGMPIPEDLTLIAGGLACYYGLADARTMVFVSLVGVLAGDSIIFYLGSHYGRRLTKKWFFKKLLHEEALNKVSYNLNTKGAKLLFAARFMPGLRAPVFFSAGTLHVPYGRFLLYNGGAALLSVPAIVLSVDYFGEQFEQIVRVIKKAEHGILLVVVVVVAALVLKWYLTKKRKKK